MYCHARAAGIRVPRRDWRQFRRRRREVSGDLRRRKRRGYRDYSRLRRDGTIGFGDFLIFAGVFGASQGDEKYDATYDLNGDGEIGFSDFVIFAQNFGKEAPSPVVTIPDANLRSAIEDALGKASGTPITAAEMNSLDRLGADTRDISDLTGLEYAANLTRLYLYWNNISDISALSGLINLRSLNLGVNKIADISILSRLTNLTHLELSYNEITDISALSGLTNLRSLYLGVNAITDISALSGLTYLRILNLWVNAITDISALSGLTNLTILDIRGNLLSDSSVNDHIPALELRGIEVRFDPFPKGDFDIELVFLDDRFTRGQEIELLYAARRWAEVIVGDLPDLEFVRDWSGECGGLPFKIPAGERIDDLRIYVSGFLRSEEGGSVAGWGGPSFLREDGHLTVLGCIGLNLEATSLIVTGPHEIGHVLGFTARVWNKFGLRQTPPDGDWHFNGPLAIPAFDDAGGRAYMGAKVPLEETGAAHWRYSVLRGELMGPRGGPALSAITVQSLADLGYGVDVSQADPYTLPGATGKMAVSTPAVPGIGENTLRPDVSSLSGADRYGQGSIEGILPLGLADGRAGGLESAERIPGGATNFNFNGDRQPWPVALPSLPAPELTCGAGLMNEPIYVVDPQGRIVRTISR